MATRGHWRSMTPEGLAATLSLWLEVWRGLQEFVLGSPTSGTFPLPLGSLPNPPMLRVTSLGSGTRCFIFDLPPLPLGELHEMWGGQPPPPGPQPSRFPLCRPTFLVCLFWKYLSVHPSFPFWADPSESLIQSPLPGSSLPFLPYKLSPFTPSSPSLPSPLPCPSSSILIFLPSPLPLLPSLLSIFSPFSPCSTMAYEAGDGWSGALIWGLWQLRWGFL